MAALPERLPGWLLPLLLLAACSSAQLAPPRKIVLLASFEGRERARGYELLASASLALQDAARADLILLPVDSGGSVADAISRVQALRSDPLVHIVVLAGTYASDSQTLAALAGMPALLISAEPVESVGEHVLLLRATSQLAPALVELYRESNPDVPESGPWAAAGQDNMLSNTESGVAARSPASIGRTTPDIQRASSLARKTAAHATSQAVPSLPRGPALRRSVRASSSI